jgi:site-specific DNA-methyltransferase (cytosine-N4-specific)
VFPLHIPVLIGADARQIPLADRSVQCIVSSPPYWQLRKYDGEQGSVWGGQSDCSHQWSDGKKVRQSAQRDHAKGGGFATSRGNESARLGMAFEVSQGSSCDLCGAWNGSYGFEPTVGVYVSHTIEIMREARRVMKDNGVLFWNIADTMRDKRLSLVPQRIAIAAEEDGWIVRNNIVWAKPNPMPESVRDRFTRSHETILMLMKSLTYYWNSEGCREPATSKDAGPDGKRNSRDVWTIPTQPFRGLHFAPFPEELPRRCILPATRPGDLVLDLFGGSGTTGKVAMEMGRRSILLDRNYTGHGGYEQLARRRVQKVIDSNFGEI